MSLLMFPHLKVIRHYYYYYYRKRSLKHPTVTLPTFNIKSNIKKYLFTNDLNINFSSFLLSYDALVPLLRCKKLKRTDRSSVNHRKFSLFLYCSFL